MPSSAMQLVFILLTMAYQTPPDRPFPAHRVIGNVYYVGSHNLASYLFVTPEGHILINSGFEETVPLIRKSVESLGFQMDDIKFLTGFNVEVVVASDQAIAEAIAEVAILCYDREIPHQQVI